MYTILTTCPDYGSMNVGDRLIEKRFKEILCQEKGAKDFLTIFREEPLESHLAEINSSRAVLLPGFPIRENRMYPNVYRLTEELSKIKVPLIPIGSNWNTYPGDEFSREHALVEGETLAFLHYVADQVESFSCREFYTWDLLRNQGIDKAKMTGDPAMFSLDDIGKSIKRPREIGKLVFTPPLSAYYVEQGEQMMTMLAHAYPQAECYCAFHLADAETATSERSENSAAMSVEVTAKNRRIRELAGELGFKVLQLAGNVEGLAVYNEFDLHVGYECHAHLYFLSKRIPSVLIAEDGRGIGFNHTLGVGGFTGFVRAQTARPRRLKSHTSGYCSSLEELALAPPSTTVVDNVKQFLEEELCSGFRRYSGLSYWLDSLYKEQMQPFIQSLP